MTPRRTKRQEPQMEAHVIPDDTEVWPPLTHTYNGSKYNATLVHRYNTTDRCLKGKMLMTNHVVTIPLPRQHPISSTEYTVNKTGEHWAHMKRLQENSLSSQGK